MSVRDQVQAFRRVADALASPAPLCDAEPPLLGQALPLADVSPFTALPGDTEQDGSSGEVAVSAAALDPAEALRSRQERAVPAGPRREAATTIQAPAVPESAGSAAAPPVFSFRRTAAVTSRWECALSASPPEMPAGVAAVSQPAPAASPTATAQRLTDVPFTRTVTGGGSAPGNEPPAQPQAGAELAAAMELLHTLATEALAGLSARPDSPTYAAAALDNPAQFDGLAPAVRPPAQQPELRPWQTAAGQPPELPSTQVEPRYAPPPPSIRSAVPAAAADAPAMPSEPDAEALASLINDVLAAQARRHGVDLS